jgi:hypothetical protein
MKRHWEWPWSESRAESITRTPGGLRSWVGGGVISLFYVPAFFSSCVSVARELCGGFYDSPLWSSQVELYFVGGCLSDSPSRKGCHPLGHK